MRAAKRQGFRARSAYKLADINTKYNLIDEDVRVVDLGAAPGSWSQYAAQKTKHQIVAVDILAMQPIDNVSFVRGDFTEDAVISATIKACGGRLIDLVLSDMSPNISGISSVDQAGSERLQQAVVRFCKQMLRADGVLLTKVFAGEAEARIRDMMAEHFTNLRPIKPPASRNSSRELYILARGFKGGGEAIDDLY